MDFIKAISFVRENPDEVAFAHGFKITINKDESIDMETEGYVLPHETIEKILEEMKQMGFKTPTICQLGRIRK